MTNQGDRIELVYTSDEHTNLEPGDRGTVTGVDDVGTVHVAWDSGSRLGLVPGEDRYKTVDFFDDHVEVIAVDFGFADAVQVDHLTDEQVDLVAAIFDKAEGAN